MPLSQEIWCDKLTEEVKCMIPQMLKLRWLAVAFAVWGHCCAWVPAHAAPQRWRERTASALDRPATPAAPLRYPPISLAVVFSSAVGLPAERWGRRTCGKSEGVEKGEGDQLKVMSEAITGGLLSEALFASLHSKPCQHTRHARPGARVALCAGQ